MNGSTNRYNSVLASVDSACCIYSFANGNLTNILVYWFDEVRPSSWIVFVVKACSQLLGTCINWSNGGILFYYLLTGEYAVGAISMLMF